MFYNLFKRTIFIIVIIFVSVNISHAQMNSLTVAVLDFKDNSPLASDELKPMQQGLADVMITTLSQISALKIVERSQLNKLVEEMSLGQSGLLEESSAQQVGKLLGAQFIVLGSFMKGFKNDIRIDCRIVKTETGVTVKAEQVDGKIKDILKLMNKLGEKVINNLDVKIESQEKQALKQLEKVCSYDVIMNYFKALEFIENKNYRKADALLSKVIEDCPNFRRAKIVRREMRTSLQSKFKRN